MALRLSNSLKAEASKIGGFGLTFTEGTTYNLDELFAEKDRKNSERGLVLNVKYEKDIRDKVINTIREEIAYQFTTDISGKEEEIKDKLVSVISDAFIKYGCKYTDVSEDCKSEINFQMTNYLSGLCTDKDMKFYVRFLDVDRIDISYDFSGSTALKSKLSDYYDRYSVLYNKELSVEEGELAITDTKKTYTTNSLDYKKYLLDGEKSTKGYTPLVTTRRPVVVVEEGSEDETSEGDDSSIYDEISMYTEIVKEYKEKLDSMAEAFEKVKAEADKIKDIKVTPVIETDYEGNLTTQWHKIPNTKAVYDFVKGYIKLTEYNEYNLYEDFWNRDFITGSTYFIKDKETTIKNIEGNYYRIKLPKYFKISQIDGSNVFSAKYIKEV